MKLLRKPLYLLDQLLSNSQLIVGRGSIVLCLAFSSLAGCGIGHEVGSPIAQTFSPDGTMVTLTWEPVNSPDVIGYYIHYGKRSPNQPGSCAYDRELFVSSPQGTVTGLALRSTYYFAASVFNGVESDCSNEVQTQT
jgi:hypothetical protein